MEGDYLVTFPHKHVGEKTVLGLIVIPFSQGLGKDGIIVILFLQCWHLMTPLVVIGFCAQN